MGRGSAASTAVGVGYGYTPVTDYGAVGNGVTDDSAAVTLGVSRIPQGGVLFFPPGSYRIADTSLDDGAAIYLSGRSDITILFAPGAELLMDNLSAGVGTSHGVKVLGACDNVRLINVKVRWKTAASSRSTGDGFHILGYPSDTVPGSWTGTTGTVSNLQMLDCQTFNAPQTGAILMGCDSPVVENFRAEDTLADGLHFNCCRRPRLTGYSAVNTGDDSLALVNYYGTSDSPTSGIYGTQFGPFSQLTLTEWCSGRGQFSSITADSGSANGVRVAGVFNASLTGITVANKSVGVIIDSGESGGAFSWTYLASRGVTVSDMAINTCDTGILARVYNSDTADDAKFWQYDASIANAVIRSCTTRPLRVQDSGGSAGAISGINVRNVRCFGSTGEVSFTGLRNGVIDGVYSDGMEIQVYGTSTAFASALSGLQDNALQIDNLFADNAGVSFQDLRRCQIGKVQSRKATASAVRFTRVTECTVADINVTLANRGNTGTVRGINFSKGQRISVERATIIHDANTTTSWIPLEFGGGDATDITTDVKIESIVYTNTINATGSGVVVQGGGFTPTNYIYKMRHYNGGEASPKWRTEHYGSTTWVDYFSYTGTPEAAITAPIGSQYMRTDGGATTTLYVKTSGTGNTGWTAK